MARAVDLHSIEACRETPSCGGAVLDRRAHRRWHERVFIQEEPTPTPTRVGPRYIGEPDPDDTDQA
jgi:hypothetical protein